LVLAVGVLPRKVPASRKAADSKERAPRLDLAARRNAEVDGRAYPTALVLAGGFAIAWTLVSALHLTLTYARAGRTRLDDPAFGEQLFSFATEVTLGRSLLATVLVAASVSVLALAVTTPTGAAWTLVLAVSAFAFQS